MFLLPDLIQVVCCAQTADKFQIKADIPGVTKQDIKLNVDGDVLSLSVQKAEQKQVRHHDLTSPPAVLARLPAFALRQRCCRCLCACCAIDLRAQMAVALYLLYCTWHIVCCMEQSSLSTTSCCNTRVWNSGSVVPVQDKKEEAKWKYHRTERSSTFVRRSLRLPEHADLSKISAK